MLCDHWALPQLIDGRCTLCGLCVESCPIEGIHLDEYGPVFDKLDTCDACGNCEEVCPEGAIVTRFTFAQGIGQAAPQGGNDGR